MKKTVSLIITVILLLGILCGCTVGQPTEKDYAAPTYIDNVRDTFNRLFDVAYEVRDVLNEAEYDYEKDEIGFIPVFEEILDIGQIMPTMDDTVLQKDMEKIEKRVTDVSTRLYDLKTTAEERFK